MTSLARPTLLTELGFTFVKERDGVTEFRLDANALKVVLAPNTFTPTVTVMPCFRVGSRNEAVGYTGATHLLEHWMFKYVRAHETDITYRFPERFRRSGAEWNAFTAFDCTAYFATVPSRYLSMCIETEADRMRNLMLDGSERDSEMRVVRNELERGENSAAGVLVRQLYATAFREHPYHATPIGWRSDVENISMERLRAFYDQFYWPDNSILFISGNFDTAEALSLVSRFYSVHPAAPHPIPKVHTVEPNQEGERRFVVRRGGDQPQLIIGFRVPHANHFDTGAIAATAALLGGNRRSSRLYKALVQTGLAAHISTSAGRLRDPGLFIIHAVPTADVSLERLEQAIHGELARLASEPPSQAELARVRSFESKELQLIRADSQSFAEALAEAEVVAEDWSWFYHYGERFASVLADDVVHVASTYFDPDWRTVGYFIPRNREAPPAQATAGGAASSQGDGAGATADTDAGTTADTDAGTTADTDANQAQAAPPAVTRVTSGTVVAELSNGLKILVTPQPGTRVVGVAGLIPTGWVEAKVRGNRLTATFVPELLLCGSKRYSEDQVADWLDETGHPLSFHGHKWETTFSTKVTPADLPELLSIIADSLRTPQFPEERLATALLQFEASIEHLRGSTEHVAGRAFSRAIYRDGEDDYAPSFDESLAEARKITRAKLIGFHRNHFSPDGMILSIVGDIEPKQALAAAEAVLKDWSGHPPINHHSATEVPPKESTRKRITVFVPDKANASVVIGQPSMLSRTAADFLAATIANAALGGDTASSRLGAAVRVKSGLTYGIGSRFGDLTHPGSPFTISFSVNPESVDAALSLVDEIVRTYCAEGIGDEELATEKDHLAGAFTVQLSSPEVLAATICKYEALGLGFEAVDEFAAKAAAVTKEEVNRALFKHIQPHRFVTVVAGTIGSP